MINLSQLNKLIITTLFFSTLIFNIGFADTAVDIWKKQEGEKIYNELKQEFYADYNVFFYHYILSHLTNTLSTFFFITFGMF